MWELSKPWYGDRMRLDFEPKSVADLQGLLDGVGLTGDFWRLPG